MGEPYFRAQVCSWMASGRGQFLVSLRQGLERTQPGRHGGNLGGSKYIQEARKREAARDGHSRRCRDKRSKLPPPPPQVVHCPAQSRCLPAPASFCKENYFGRLPPEIILKIFSYLDAASLFCVGFVNRQFHKLANDNAMWYELYSCEVSRRKPGPRLFKMAYSVSADAQEVPAEEWKKLVFSELGYHKDAVWKNELRHVNLNTGMPEQTEQVLRSLHVVWEITLTHRSGKHSVYEQSRTFFSTSSITVCWSGGVWPYMNCIFSMQLHGVLGSPTAIPAKPQWRSLISKTVVSRRMKWRYIGTDRLVKLVQFGEEITVGVWRGTWKIAFIMATLHFHRLVERTVLGSLFCPYRPEELSTLDSDIPMSFKAHGYTVFLLLHNSVRCIMHCRYSHVLCARDKLHSEFVQLRPVIASMSQKHTLISDKISFHWEASKLQGDIKNCCMVTVSVLDEAQRPVWCISSSAALHHSHSPAVSETYDGQQFSLWFEDTNGKLKMTLVWMQELQLHVLISLHIWIRMEKLNPSFHKAVLDKF